MEEEFYQLSLYPSLNIEQIQNNIMLCLMKHNALQMDFYIIA